MCLLSSVILGIISLYSGLYGQGTPWTAVSAATGTASLGLAALPSINLQAVRRPHRLDHTNLTGSENPRPAPRPARGSAASKLYRYLEYLLSDKQIVRRAKALKGRRAQLLVALLKKIIVLEDAVFDRRCRGTAGDILFELVHSGATASPDPTTAKSRDPRPSGRVRPVRSSSLTFETLREMQAFRSTQHLNLDVFRDDAAAEVPRDDDPIARVGVDSTPGVSRLHIISGVSAAVTYLHSQARPLVHGDIRAANIRVDPDSHEAVLELPMERWVHRASTTYHITHNDIGRHLAPEQLPARDNPDAGMSAWSDSLSKSADVFSLGMTLFELMTGAAPFADMEDVSSVTRAVAVGDRPRVPSTADLAKFFMINRDIDIRESSSSSTSSYSYTSSHTHVDLEGGYMPISTVEDEPVDEDNTSNEMRTAMTSLLGLLETMWAQNPAQRPSAPQVEARLQELLDHTH
ncbi:kinase-like protein [Clavulina sp. PMI_390]|nr:kinase-like protein [Clavulina sp. PMI_390]